MVFGSSMPQESGISCGLPFGVPAPDGVFVYVITQKNQQSEILHLLQRKRFFGSLQI